MKVKKNVSIEKSTADNLRELKEKYSINESSIIDKLVKHFYENQNLEWLFYGK